MINLTFSKKNPPIGGFISCCITGVEFQWGNETQLVLDDSVSLITSQSISRHVARVNPAMNLYPMHILQRTQVDHWLSQASLISYGGSIKPVLQQLNAALAPAHCLVPPLQTVADYEMFAALYCSKDWQKISESDEAPVHVLRWYNSVLTKVSGFLDSLTKDLRAASQAAATATSTSSEEEEEKASTSAGGPSGTKRGSAASGGKGTSKREEGGKFVDLPDAKEGEVVVRFPPEASGYLHIGHAKAALLNQHYQQLFKGKLIMRFDDTNPAKEDAHFEQMILDDLKLLQVKPDRFTHTSDYFDLMLEMCEKLIKNGDAFVDDTDAETMKAEREERKESRNRNNSVEKNLSMWEEMKKGSALGQQCAVRAKIDMGSNNGCMRDPAIYRCKPETHVRTGNKYKVYPTYDFACPIVDSIEGVTHSLRTTEYHDRDEQFFWFLEKMSLRKLHIYEYSRLNMNNTVLSKRKLTWFVEQGLVDGWDDPRFPTVRGIIRRGMTVEGLKDFIIAQGSSRSVVNMEWDKIWSFNKKVIDASAPRYVALEKDTLVPVNVVGVKLEATTAQKHPKDPSIGTKTVWVGPKVLIEQVDAEELKEGENATFINWGNLKIIKLNRDNGKVVSVDAEPNLSNTDYKKTLKLTWLVDAASAPLTPVVVVYFDHLITKSVLGKDEDFKNFIGRDTRHEVAMVGDDELKTLKVGDIIQLQRKGFFRVDEQYVDSSLSGCKSSPIVLFSVPDGHSKDSGAAAAAAASTAKKAQAASIKEVAQSAKGKQAEKSPQDESRPIVVSGADAIVEIHLKIKEQGDKIRQLKAEKADKNVVMSEVAVLKDLKASFSSKAGVEWTPDINMDQFKTPASGGNKDVSELHQRVVNQGNNVRNLKANKADKATVTAAVNDLLALKKDFKAATGVEWKPDIDVSRLGVDDGGTTAPSAAATVSSPQADNDPLSVHNQIVDQGNVVRNLKSKKASKDDVSAAVNILLELKKQFKAVSGLEWVPSIDVSKFSSSTQAAASASVATPVSDVAAAATTVNSTSVPAPVAANSDGLSLHNKIVEQGNVVRNLKSNKAEKSIIKDAVDVLLQLKKEFRICTNIEWKPDMDISQFGASPAVNPDAATAADSGNQFDELNAKVKAQGDKVRQLKSSGADKSIVKSEVDVLLQYKQEFKNVFGVDWKPDMKNPSLSGATSVAPPKQAQPKETKKQPKKEEPKMADGKKQTRLGLEIAKEENLSEWYSQVITKSEMIEYYSVSGCYILRPWSYAIWDFIKDFFDREIKKLGVENSYFPIFVSRDALEKEKAHIADFSPEVAWVTRSGSSEMAEPVAIRPTSETVMYPSFAKWIQSHRDLPLRLNQWNNVVRWEFKQPTPFLRTREFLWQEGHTAFATQAEATEEVYQILDLYGRVYEELLAIPVIKGKKTEKEKFAGGDFTTTTEAYIAGSGRGIQGATSHHLGQNFSRMMDIVFEDPNTQEKQYVYQNSWGITTRTIGVMVMVHGDDKGLVLPPRVACVQAIIMPVGITVKVSEEDKKSLHDACQALAKELNEGGIRTRADFRDNVTPAWKFNHWELKGVPLRLEVGPREVASGQVFVVRRDTGEKQALERSSIVSGISALLSTIQQDMLDHARKVLNTHTTLVSSWSSFCSTLDEGHLILSPFCGIEDCEDRIKKESARDQDCEAGAPSMGAKSLCIPFQQPQPLPAGSLCIHPQCGQLAQYYCLFGRSY
ncbi:Proline-tRNA ligase class IIa archaeal-type [Trinorchestia longiramus]|nr:Proline-tRNA ligase class IIa archaeal-type [Trinorchestia longiramus]